MIGRCDVGAVARGWSGLTEHRGCSLGEVGVLRYRSCRRLVVIATHLDEDISAAGGLIARLAEQDVPIDVLAVTDGDGATVGAEGATPPHELGRRRAHRSVSYRRLGAYQVRRHELALRSNTIADAEADVVAALSEILGFDPDPCAAWVLAPWQHDGHADHDAVGRAAAVVCHAYRARLVEYLVTSWSSAGLHGVPWGRARQLPLTPLLHLRKLHAISTLGLRADGSLVGDREIFLAPQDPPQDGRRRGLEISRARRAVCG
jgi:LmbE family N-acetylglucosaminyl deacetylase